MTKGTSPINDKKSYISRPDPHGRLVRGGIIFILVVSPLLFGSVQTLIFFSLELFTLFLFVLWLIKVWVNASRGRVEALHRSGRSGDHVQGHGQRQEIKDIKDKGAGERYGEKYALSHNPGLTLNPFIIALALLILLLVFQLIPLPPGLLKSLSPTTYQMYHAILPGWKNIADTAMEGWPEAVSGSGRGRHPEASQREAASLQLGPEAPASSQPKDKDEGGFGQATASTTWRPLSFNPYLTKLVLFRILAYALIFFLIIKNVDTYSQARRMILVIIFLGLFQSVYGLIDLLTGHNYIFFYKKAVGQGAVTGTFINRNHLAGYLVMIIPLALAYVLERFESQRIDQEGSWRARLSSIENKFSKYSFMLFTVAIMAVALIFSLSRMGIVSLSVALAFMGFILCWHRRRKFLQIIFVVAIMVILILGTLAGLEAVMQRFETLDREMTAEGQRLDVWKDSLQMIKDYPWFGIGAGNYQFLFPRYRSFPGDLLYDHAHNDYLEMMVETGRVGMAIFLIGAIYYAIIGLRFLIRYRESSRWITVLGGLTGILAISLHGITDFNMHIPANALLFFALLGLVYRVMQLRGEKVRIRRKMIKLRSPDSFKKE